MRRTVILLALFVLGLFQSVAGQHNAVEGDRVRVSTRDAGGPIVGTVVSMASERLVLAPEGGGAPVTLPFVSVRQVDVSRGRSPSWGTTLSYGALGAVLGAAAGALAGPLVMSSDCRTVDRPGDNLGNCLLQVASGEDRARAAVMFGAVGFGVGAIIGTIVGSERWDAIPVGPVRIAFGQPAKPRVTAGLSFGW
jgi:hypothetical protein